MDTVSLLDDHKQASLRTELSLQEKYKTRLLRVDQGPRARQDPLQRYMHKLFRMLQYRRMATVSTDKEGGPVFKPSSQNTTLLADITGRIIVAIALVLFLIVPLAILARETSETVQLTVVSVFIVIFACVVTIMLRASNLEMMIVSAAYAAILSVFVSNNTAK